MESMHTTAVYKLTHPSEEAEEQSQMLSFEGRQIFQIVNCVFLSSIIGLFGIAANIINIAIFFGQGLSNTVNISLFGMAISDLCSLLTMEWLVICLNPLFDSSRVPWVMTEIQYLTGGWPHVCFTRITSCITAYVTAERCLCITLPLKVKHIITPTRTKIAICTIYIFMILSLVPEYTTAYLDWRFYPPQNRTMLRLVFTSNRSHVEGTVFVLNATLSLASFVAVIICTGILIWKLKSMAKWRKLSTFENGQSESICVRDKKTVSLILIIASILIICNMPGTSLLLITFFEPEFSVTGKYVNIFIAAWSFGLLFATFNASVNIILYYKMSTRYRETFHRIFKCKTRGTTPLLDCGVDRSNTITTWRASCDKSDSETTPEDVFDMQEIEVSGISMSPGTSSRRVHFNGNCTDSSGKRQVQLTPKLRDKVYHSIINVNHSREKNSPMALML